MRPEFRPTARHACGSSRATRRWRTSPRCGPGSIGNRVGEVDRSEAWHRVSLRRVSDRAATGSVRRSTSPIATDTPSTGSTEQWNDGQPAHNLRPHRAGGERLPTRTPRLWHTLLGVDLVGPITSRQVPIDDPLPYPVDQPARPADDRVERWRVGQRSRCRGVLRRRGRYGTADRIVIEVDGARWAIDGGPDGATCSRVRSRPDLVARSSPRSAPCCSAASRRRRWPPAGELEARNR